MNASLDRFHFDGRAKNSESIVAEYRKNRKEREVLIWVEYLAKLKRTNDAGVRGNGKRKCVVRNKGEIVFCAVRKGENVKKFMKGCWSVLGQL